MALEWLKENMRMLLEERAIRPSPFPNPRVRSGVWTPDPKFGGNNLGMTISSRSGIWYSVDTQFFAQGRIDFSLKGSSTGAFSAEGLPFKCNATLTGYGNMHRYFVMNTMPVGGYVQAVVSGTSKIVTFGTGIAASLQGGIGLTDTNFNNTSIVEFNVQYTLLKGAALDEAFWLP